MTIWWNTCRICGDSFPSTDPSATDCGNRNKHARQDTQKRRKDDKKDGKK